MSIMLHLHAPSGDIESVEVSSVPSLWLESDTHALTDGFYVQVMMGTIHNETHVHYELKGTSPHCIPNGYVPHKLSQYLTTVPTWFLTSGQNTRTRPRLGATPLTLIPVSYYPSTSFPSPGYTDIVDPPSSYRIEPPCVCIDPSVHSVHCQYIKWKRGN